MNGISIIITFYNGISSLEQCISIVKTSLKNEKNQEILIVNDNPEIHLESIAEKYGTRLINMPRNMGYAGACNRSVPLARYDTLLFMDCDIYPSGDWFEHMKNTYHDIDEKGCVSAAIYETDTGNLFGYGMAVYEIDILLFLRHGFPTQFSQEDRDFPIVSSGCMMMSKALYMELGGQDELCMNIHCDVDLAFRVLKKGYRNRMCAKAKVFHRGQISGPIRTIPFRQDVKAYLFKKWGSELGSFWDVKEIFHGVWSCFDIERLNGRNIIVISFSNSLYRYDYIKMLEEYFNLNVLQIHDIRNIKGESHIILQEAAGWDICRFNVPILYFSDDYRLLSNNYYWFSNRAYTPDLIADKNGNLMYSPDYHFEV